MLDEKNRKTSMRCTFRHICFVSGRFCFSQNAYPCFFCRAFCDTTDEMIRVYCSDAMAGSYDYRARRNTVITSERAGREWTRFLFYAPVKLYPIENAPYLGSLPEKAAIVEVSLTGLPEGHLYELRILLEIMKDGKCVIFLPYTEKESLTRFGRTGEMEARWFELPDDMYFTIEYLDKLVRDRTDG